MYQLKFLSVVQFGAYRPVVFTMFGRPAMERTPYQLDTSSSDSAELTASKFELSAGNRYAK
jgi:hypothetical protein